MERITPPYPVNHSRRGFTLIELLVVISIIALLISILLPALGAARKSARNVQCLSNQRQCGIAMATYANTYDDLVRLYGHNGSNPQSIYSSRRGFAWWLYEAGLLEPGHAVTTTQPSEGDAKWFMCSESTPTSNNLRNAMWFDSYGANQWIQRSVQGNVQRRDQVRGWVFMDDLDNSGTNTTSGHFGNLATLERASDSLMLADTTNNGIDGDAPIRWKGANMWAPHNSNSVNAIFFDMHAGSTSLEDLRKKFHPGFEDQYVK